MIESTKKHPTSVIKLLCLFLILFAITSPPLFASDNSEDGIYVFSKDTVFEVHSFDLKRGERLFHGLIPLGKEVPACADCHHTSYIDTLNWNPSAYDISKIYAGKNIEALIKVVNKPAGTKLPQVHKGYEIDQEQAVLLQAYLEKLNIQKAPERKPIIDNLLLFILVNIIGLIVLIDLIYTHKIPFKAVHLIIILGVTVYILRVLVVEGINSGRQENYSPLQPVKFSHKIHAGDNKIDCQYCHNLAETSKSAGIPSNNVCMNCHVLIVEGTQSGKFEINKIHKAQESMTPIEWVKIHNLPDHVFFSHAQHVGVGKLDCAECHGPVEDMHVVKQFSDLSMGWCLDCHKTRGVDFIDNNYYSVFKEYHNKITAGTIDSVLVEDIGGTNCMKCHY